ncbi:MAG: DUF4214 domain-containing protein, partial [Lachnospiraceae bacterium]|nr:DUF4214 domain-containing protein [Lachnospiraceae bacterium]
MDGQLDGSMTVPYFIFSDEYKARGTNNTQFVQDLYTMFMGREPDTDGFNYWKSELSKGSSREKVFAGFANSDEFYNLCKGYGITAGYYSDAYDLNYLNKVNLFVERLYKTCLNRIGDKDGQKYWTEGLLKISLGGISCAANFVKSKEYEARNLSDEEYVKNLYIAFMGREFDQTGLDYWLGQLREGKGHDFVFNGFAVSPEFEKICTSYGIRKGLYPPKAPVRKNSYSDGRLWDYVIIEYDALGRESKKTIYDVDDTVKSYSVFSHNEAARKATETFYSRNGIVTGYHYHEYYDDYSEKRVLMQDNRGKLLGVAEYANNGLKTREITYTESGAVATLTTYDYNSDRSLARVVEYTGESTLKTISEYQNGHVVKLTGFRADKTVEYIDEYDPQTGEVICEYNYDKNGALEKRYVYQYIANVHIMYIYGPDGRLISWEEDTYNEHGELINVVVHDGDSSASDDNTGNATQYTFRNNDRLLEHWQKHGDEFNYATMDEYVAGANRVIHDPKSLHKAEAEDGDDIFYLEASNEFVVLSVDGYIRTYFRPDKGIEYFNKQK